MAIDPQSISDCIHRLWTARNRSERADVLTHYARQHGISEAHLRRLAKAAGVDFGYARRSDRGVRSRPLLAAAASAVATLIVKTNGDMPTWRAIEYAKRLGLIDKSLDLKHHYVDRYIREQRIQRADDKAPAATRKCKWGECGETLQIDSTNCAQWFFTEPDGSIRLTMKGEVYRNKPAKADQVPIIRYIAIDPPSGLFRVQYYQVGGESAQVLLDFLYFAMCRSADPERMPMAGVPRWLVIDKGPGNMSTAALSACEALGIERRAHATGHSWAKGTVENMMYLWERSFESELRLHPAKNINDLNRRAFEFSCILALTRSHSRLRMPRAQFYCEHCPSIILPPPWEMYVEAATTRRVERTVVGGSLISYEGREYYVGALAGVRTGDKVEVAKAILEWDEATRPVRIYYNDQTVIELAQVKDSNANYVDERIYTKRQDVVLDAVDTDRQIRLAVDVPQEAPSAGMADLPTEKAPEARLLMRRPAAAMPTKRRTSAMLELADRVGRELTRFEIAGLGWADNVPQNEIDAAADRLAGVTAQRPQTQTNAASVAAG